MAIPWRRAPGRRGSTARPLWHWQTDRCATGTPPSSHSPPALDRHSPRARARQPPRSRRHLGIGIQATAFGDEPFEKRRRPPIVAESRAILVDACEDQGQADRFRVEHRPAAMTGEAEAVAVDHVDVAGAAGVAFLDDARAFVGQRRRDARDDLLARDRSTLDTALRSGLRGKLVDERIGDPRSTAGLIAIPPCAGL